MDNKKRTAIQLVATLIQNANFKGFFTGKISEAPTKSACVPGLNCYSCPGAIGACPIGSLQSSLSRLHIRIPYYVAGLLIFFGVILGRLICGFLCPFGFLQDLIYMIPIFKKHRVRTFKGDGILRYLKYFILVICVLLIPSLVRFTPFFCKYICPSGTVSGILLALADHKILSALGGQFIWKASVLGIILVTSLFIARPFCRYVCPLGAFYGLFNKISIVRLKVNEETCTHCGACARCCPMAVDPSKNPDSAECIRCGKCVSECNGSLHLGFVKGDKK